MVKADCAGQEIDIPEEKAKEMEDALEELKVEQDKLLQSERYLIQQRLRKGWSELTWKQKLMTLLGRDPNGHS